MTKEQHEQSEIDFKKLKDSGVVSSPREAVVFLEAYELALNIPSVRLLYILKTEFGFDQPDDYLLKKSNLKWLYDNLHVRHGTSDFYVESLRLVESLYRA